jgi:uncharacterized protein DUF932
MSLHSFTAGTPQNKPQVPLTMDEIARVAPSALATRPYAEMSSKYAFVPTIGIIEGMMKAGFQPFSATQSLTRVEGKQPFAKHMLRFRHQDAAQALAVGDVIPEVVLVNSHDGECTFRLMAGLYRLACSNGLMVAEASIMSIIIRHTGRILQDVVAGSEQLTGDAGKALGTVKAWQQLQLTDGERSAFAQSAHALRFADADGKVTSPVGLAITPDRLLEAHRYQDHGKDLWTTFNVTQENVIAGGLRGIQRDEAGRRVRRVTTRQVKGIDSDVKLNRSLWMLAEKMAALKTGVPFADAEVVQAA